MSREVRDTPRDAPSVQPAPAPAIQAPPGWSISPSGLAALGIIGSLFAAGAGAIGSYAVTGWRVTALEGKAAMLDSNLTSATRALEAKLESTASIQGATSQRVAVVETRLDGLAKGIDRLEAGLGRVESKLDTLKVSH